MIKEVSALFLSCFLEHITLGLWTMALDPLTPEVIHQTAGYTMALPRLPILNSKVLDTQKAVG